MRFGYLKRLKNNLEMKYNACTFEVRHQTNGTRPDTFKQHCLKYPGGSGSYPCGGFQSGVATSRQAYLFITNATPAHATDEHHTAANARTIGRAITQPPAPICLPFTVRTFRGIRNRRISLGLDPGRQVHANRKSFIIQKPVDHVPHRNHNTAGARTPRPHLPGTNPAKPRRVYPIRPAPN